MNCGYLVECGKCQQTTCPDYPVPVSVGDCGGCGNPVYGGERHYEINGEPVHYDCLHAYHADELRED